MMTITKRFGPYPAAHRQPKHDGHCAQVHGHNWYFEVTLTADKLDPCGFILDVGKMDDVKAWFDENFDHTILLNLDDPLLLKFLKWDAEFQAVSNNRHLFKIVKVSDCSMEGLARWVGRNVQEILNRNPSSFSRGVRVVSVTCYEDEKNSSNVKF